MRSDRPVTQAHEQLLREPSGRARSPCTCTPIITFCAIVRLSCRLWACQQDIVGRRRTAGGKQRQKCLVGDQHVAISVKPARYCGIGGKGASFGLEPQGRFGPSSTALSRANPRDKAVEEGRVLNLKSPRSPARSDARKACFMAPLPWTNFSLPISPGEHRDALCQAVGQSRSACFS